MEFRSTVSGFLGDVRGLQDEPEGEYQPGVVSLVTAQSEGRVRRLPTLYVSTISVFSHRDLAVMRQAAQHFLRVLAGEGTDATYRLSALRYRDATVLYGRDFFNRSPFRLRLERLGFEFAFDPYVSLRSDGLFECEGWEPFAASYVVLEGEPEADEVAFTSPGELAFVLGTYYRVGELLSKDDLSALARATSGAKGVTVAEPEALKRMLDE